MSTSPHAELINTMTTLYKLLGDLAAIPPDRTIFPSPATGTHGPDVFNAANARAAGYSEDAVSVMSQLPYLDFRHDDDHFSIMPSTYPESYLDPYFGVDDYAGMREMLEDEVMPPQTLRLSWVSIYGTEFMYDTQSKLVYSWRPFESDDYNYYNAPSAPPHEAFAKLIHDWRSLRYLGTPDGRYFDDAVREGQGPPDGGGVTGKMREAWYAQQDICRAEAGLRNIYLECGWDPEAEVQLGFDRARFLERRDAYWEVTVRPLIERADRI